MGEPNHFRRVSLLWLIASAIATPLVVVLLGPNMPPGNLSTEASDQVVTNMVMLGMVTPVVMLILVYFIYAIVVFRARQGEEALEGPAVRGHTGVQVTWIAVTSAMVLFLAAFGSYELLNNGSGGGQGPSPIADPPGKALQVQVIAEQWQFTYRFPAYGGVETPHLELPVGQLVEFHVTSLDVTHSFWAYELGLKADANQGVDNIAYVTPQRIGPFSIRCAELCGLWHGYMFDTGHVVSRADFAAWIHQQQATFAPITPKLEQYSRTYFPQPQRRGG